MLSILWTLYNCCVFHQGLLLIVEAQFDCATKTIQETDRCRCEKQGTYRRNDCGVEHALLFVIFAFDLRSVLTYCLPSSEKSGETHSNCIEFIWLITCQLWFMKLNIDSTVYSLFCSAIFCLFHSFPYVLTPYGLCVRSLGSPVRCNSDLWLHF